MAGEVAKGIHLIIKFSVLVYQYRQQQRVRDAKIRAERFITNLAAILKEETKDSTFLGEFWAKHITSKNTLAEKNLAIFTQLLLRYVVKRYAGTIQELSRYSKQPAKDWYIIAHHVTSGVYDDFIELSSGEAAKLLEPEAMKKWLDIHTLDRYEKDHRLKLSYGKPPEGLLNDFLAKYVNTWSVGGLNNAPFVTPTGMLSFNANEADENSYKYTPILSDKAPPGYRNAHPMPSAAYELPPENSFQIFCRNHPAQMLVNILSAKLDLVQKTFEVTQGILREDGFVLHANNDIIIANLRLMRSQRHRLTRRIFRGDYQRGFSALEKKLYSPSPKFFLSQLHQYQKYYLHHLYLTYVWKSHVITTWEANLLANEIAWLDIVLSFLKQTFTEKLDITDFKRAEEFQVALKQLQECCYLIYSFQFVIEKETPLPASTLPVNARILEILEQIKPLLGITDRIEEGPNLQNVRKSEIQEIAFAAVKTGELYLQITNRANNVPIPFFSQLVPRGTADYENLPKSLKKAILFAAIRLGNLPLVRQFRNECRWNDGANTEFGIVNRSNLPSAAKDKRYYSALHEAALFADIDVFNVYWSQALGEYRNDRATLKALLENMRGLDGATVLHSAAYGGNPSIVAKLLSIGLSPTILDDRNATPLHMAVNSLAEDRNKCLALLIDKIPEKERAASLTAKRNFDLLSEKERADKYLPKEVHASVISLLCLRAPDLHTLEVLLKHATLTFEEQRLHMRELCTTRNILTKQILSPLAENRADRSILVSRLDECNWAIKRFSQAYPKLSSLISEIGYVTIVSPRQELIKKLPSISIMLERLEEKIHTAIKQSNINVLDRKITVEYESTRRAVGVAFNEDPTALRTNHKTAELILRAAKSIIITLHQDNSKVFELFSDIVNQATFLNSLRDQLARDNAPLVGWGWFYSNVVSLVTGPPIPDPVTVRLKEQAAELSKLFDIIQDLSSYSTIKALLSYSSVKDETANAESWEGASGLKEKLLLDITSKVTAIQEIEKHLRAQSTFSSHNSRLVELTTKLEDLTNFLSDIRHNNWPNTLRTDYYHYVMDGIDVEIVCIIKACFISLVNKIQINPSKTSPAMRDFLFFILRKYSNEEGGCTWSYCEENSRYTALHAVMAVFDPTKLDDFKSVLDSVVADLAYNKTLLQDLTDIPLLNAAATTLNTEALPHLLEAKAAIDAVDSERTTALHIAAKSTSDASQKRLFILTLLAYAKPEELERIINMQDSAGMTALHYVCETDGDLRTINFLLDSGVNSSLENANNLTALALAEKNFTGDQLLEIQEAFASRQEFVSQQRPRF